jgi:ubiquinone/menaquinone biosynthesis C-methylase UbiE
MQTTATSNHPYSEAYGGSATENYERYFVPTIGGPLAADLVAEAGLRPGERVLDVACGTGVVARLAAERVGAGGAVSGVDTNAGMLAVARSLPAPAGAPISWYETPAESMPLPDGAFDVVFCQLGLQFVADKPAAVREMHRVAAAGGRVLVSVPGPTRFFNVLEDAFTKHIPPGAGFVRMVFSLNDAAAIEQLFRGAGFEDVTVKSHEKVLNLPSPREFLWQYIQSTPLSGLVAEAEGGTLAALERDVVAGWQPWMRDGGMSCEQDVIVTTAHR